MALFLLKTCRFQIIYVARNPKDVVQSYHKLLRWNLEIRIDQEDLGAFVDAFTNGNGKVLFTDLFSNITRHFKISVWYVIKSITQLLFPLSYVWPLDGPRARILEETKLWKHLVLEIRRYCTGFLKL